MRGNTTLAEDINEKWLKTQYAGLSPLTGVFADKYNNYVAENTFSITDNKTLDVVKDTKVKSKLKRKYCWNWEKDLDNGIKYDFATDLMTFEMNSSGEVLAYLTDLYLTRADLEIPTIKYSYFFAQDNELRLTVPNQADDGLGIAYINDSGELIIDNTQV